MGVLLTLTVGGLAVGASRYIIGKLTEKKQIKAEIKKLKNQNEQLENLINYVEGIKAKLTSSKDYLVDGREDFKNGGHVYDGVPLAETEFTFCIASLDVAIKSASNLITDFNDTIAYNLAEIKKLEKKL